MPESKTFIEAAITLLKPSIKYWPFAAATGILGALMLLVSPNPRLLMTRDWSLMLFFASPLLLGFVLAVTKSDMSIRANAGFEGWIHRRREAIDVEGGFFRRWVVRPGLWVVTKLMELLNRCADSYVRSGLKAAAYLYLIGVTIYFAIVVTVVVLTLIFISVVLMLLSFFAGGGRGPSSSAILDNVRQRDSSRHRSARGASGESREREGLLGKFTEHTDEHGKVIGESREREGLLGKFTEHTDEHGKVIGESREREGLLGNYAEHMDEHGKVIGESREREGLLGNYAEHTDEHGKVIGESREREGLLGKFVEHKSRKP